jgi:putative NADPH-quinone reductase
LVDEMKILVVLAHPDSGSFNHAIANMAITTLRDADHTVIFHDLYREKFNPLLTIPEIPKDVLLPPVISKHCLDATEADGIIIVHPNWWGQPPAILKGWVDRVFRPGVAYKFEEGDRGEGIPVGLLKAETAIVFTTSNTAPEREREVFGDPLETLWKNCIFGLCGVTNFYRQNFGIIITSSIEQRESWLAEVREIVSAHFPRV